MKLAYIAAPYTAPTHIQTIQNINEAKIIAQYYWITGYAVICPHLNTSFFSGLIPEKQFYLGTIEMLKKCDLAIFHPDFRNSSGAIEEFIKAKENNIQVKQLQDFEFEDIKRFVRDHIKGLK